MHNYKPYRLPNGISFCADGSPLLVVVHDLKYVVRFIQGICDDTQAFSLKFYEDWWEHDGLHFFKTTIGLRELWGMIESPKSLLSAMTGEELVFLGVSDQDNTWYLRFTADTEFDSDTIIAAYSFTCCKTIALRFRQSILPLTRAEMRILASAEHYHQLTR